MVDIDWDFFYRQLEAGYHIDETCFYFSDDAEEEVHYIGFIAKYECPYWAGYCDIPNGCEFSTAEELVTAPIYQFVFVEFEDVNVDYRLKTANSETDKVRKGLNQIRDWKRWIEQHREYFLGGEGIREIAHNVPLWGFRYCLVVGRRNRMDDISNQLRGELQRDAGVTIMSYDRLVDYVGLLHNGI